MQTIDKKGLKKLDCPKCHRPKLRFQHSKDGIEPDGGSTGDRRIYCDVCKVYYQESDAAIQSAFRQLQAERTPPPVAVRHH